MSVYVCLYSVRMSIYVCLYSVYSIVCPYTFVRTCSYTRNRLSVFHVKLCQLPDEQAAGMRCESEPVSPVEQYTLSQSDAAQSPTITSAATVFGLATRIQPAPARTSTSQGRYLARCLPKLCHVGVPGPPLHYRSSASP